jgi:hypothetical protein
MRRHVAVIPPAVTCVICNGNVAVVVVVAEFVTIARNVVVTLCVICAGFCSARPIGCVTDILVADLVTGANIGKVDAIGSARARAEVAVKAHTAVIIVVTRPGHDDK